MKEWYLMTPNTRPNLIGGYENESFVDYKEDAFYEVLSTDLATDVKLYNSDRTEYIDLRCIIQNNTGNTQLKSMERDILAPIGTLKAGMYVLFENGYWLVSGYPGNNGVYEKSTLILCQCVLKWQDDDGKIIERPANVTSAAKYDTGTEGNNTIIVASNNFTIWVPDDDDSSTLEGKRVFIDRNVSNPRKVFEITRSDDVLYLYGEEHGGILSFIADRDEFNPLVDRPDLGLCDYVETIPEPDETPDGSDDPQKVSATISGGSSIKCNLVKSWNVQFLDDEGNDVLYQNYTWNVVSDFEIIQSATANKIMLRVVDESAIGSSFLLQICSDGLVLDSVTIYVSEGI